MFGTYFFIGFIWALIYRMIDIATYDVPDTNKIARYWFIFNMCFWPAMMLIKTWRTLFSSDYTE